MEAQIIIADASINQHKFAIKELFLSDHKRNIKPGIEINAAYINKASRCASLK